MYADVDTTVVLRFIERVCNHMSERFPDGELQEWIAFDTQAILAQTKFDFGKTEVEKLTEKYKHFLTQEDTPTAISSEYSEFKFVVKEKLKTGSIKTFADVVEFVLSEEKFSKLVKLVDICETFQASSADAECGLSLMNSIKTKQRNRLEVDHLDMLMRIKFYLTSGSGQMVNLEMVYNYWKNNKIRREKL